VIGDPSHEEHENMLEWLGGRFDPERFNAKAVKVDDPGKRWAGGIRQARSEPTPWRSSHSQEALRGHSAPGPLKGHMPRGHLGPAEGECPTLEREA
jgi:hypothetical protein